MKDQIINWLAGLPNGDILTNKWVFAVLVIIATAVLAKLLLVVYKQWFRAFSKKTKTEIDDIIVDRTEKPIFYLILAGGLKLAVTHVTINLILFRIIDSIMAAALVFIIHRVFDIFLDSWGRIVAKRTKTSLDDVLLPLLHKASVTVFVIIALLWILNIWGVNITPYLAGVGISGLVLGLALQDSLKNVFGGISLIFDKTFRIGDKIKIESGELGIVHDIGLRSTKIRTYDNEVIVVPNGQLANSRIQNYTKPNARIRVGVSVGVEYGADVEKVKKVISKALSKIDGVMSDPTPSVNFVAMGDFSLDFKIFFWVDNWRESYTKKLEATQVVYEALNKAKIGIAYPTQTVYVKK